MVVQMPCADRKFLFVASSLRDNRQADREIVDWASIHGYQAPSGERVFTLYSPDVSPREWRLLVRFSTRTA